MATPHQLNTSFNGCFCIQICAIYETSILQVYFISNNSLLFILNESVMKFVFVCVCGRDMYFNLVYSLKWVSKQAKFHKKYIA